MVFFKKVVVNFILGVSLMRVFIKLIKMEVVWLNFSIWRKFKLGIRDDWLKKKCYYLY